MSRSTTGNKGKPKDKGGRPSVYKDSYCGRVLLFMAQGFSLTAFAGVIGVSRETVYAWGDSVTGHKEFAEALARGRAARALYWERRLQAAEKDTRAVIFALRNACGEEWKDKPEVVVNNSVHVDTSKPPEEWGEAELREELVRRGALPRVVVSGSGVKSKAQGQKTRLPAPSAANQKSNVQT